MSKNTKDVVEDKDYSLERVPATARKGFWPMFFIMLGFTFFSASMSVGAKLGIGLNLQGFIWAVLIGSIVLGLSGLCCWAAFFWELIQVCWVTSEATLVCHWICLHSILSVKKVLTCHLH